jgi:hypothetical protein
LRISAKSETSKIYQQENGIIHALFAEKRLIHYPAWKISLYRLLPVTP